MQALTSISISSELKTRENKIRKRPQQIQCDLDEAKQKKMVHRNFAHTHNASANHKTEQSL